MKKNIHKKWIIPAALVLLLLGAAFVYAFYFHTTQTEVNEFAAAEVSCETNEVWDGTTKSSITVTNTGTIAAYVRVRLTSYWLNGSGNIGAKSSEMPSFTLGDGWIYDEGNATCYYTKPLEPGETTPNMLASVITLKEDDGYTQTLDLLSEAIQAEPTTAVEDAWSVSVGEDGVIQLGN